MKNICNLFRPIDKTNGNFLLFSQYVEDVSRSAVDSAYRVRPSEFVCLDFNQAIQSKAQSLTPNLEGGSITNYIPAYFQNFFENGVSALKNENVGVSPFNFTIGFMDKLVALTANGSNIGLQDYIKYVGNIDLESWEDGFADVVLDISSGAHKVTATLVDTIGEVSVGNANNFSQQCCGSRTYSNEYSIQENAYYIQGWKDNDDLPIKGKVPATGEIGIGVKNGWSNPWNSAVSPFHQLITLETGSTSDNSFTFNTIIVFYDIFDASNNVLYSGIPMGIYFTGVGESSGIGNDVTIYNSSVEAYGAGSGWALRICTKFSPTPYGYLQVEEVALESKSITKSISTILSATAEAIKAVNDFASKSISELQSIKNITALFKNSRTNVPYPMEVNGVKYWFVNGRNTEVPCTV